MDTEDILVAEASILNVAGGTGEATCCYNLFYQLFYAIITGVVLAGGQFQDIMMTSPLFPCKAVPISKTG
jgi:hypothetical protein